MRPVLLCLMFCSTVLRPTKGSRLGRLEDEVKHLKTFIFRELSIIRDDVKEVSNRVDILENATVTHDQTFLNQNMDLTSYNLVEETVNSGKQLVRAENNEASHVVTAEVQTMRKAYSNDKKDLHQLKQDVKGQLRELEHKISSHMHNLAADVQHNIVYIHANISLANVALSEFLNGSISKVSMFSDNIKKEIKTDLETISQQLTLHFNKTESKIKQNISSTFRHNEDNLERFLTLADRNVSEMMLKADNIFSWIRTNISEMPSQITNLSLEIQTTKHEIKGVVKRLGDKFDSTLGDLEKEIGYYYPSAKDIRLANASVYGSNGLQGRLEVRHNSIWGTVCDDYFQTNNVNVVCRMFGFRECDYLGSAGLGRGRWKIWMDNVACGGRESSFIECPHNGWGSHDCSHHEDVGIRMWN
ncbi:uncharacterized protein LOC128222266 [Mya arenaria]|uniref:uncharacterized protein LOC128222266 n=1 Tax=Mya arenaria TaxID=6604 RepID=UPI0022E773EA|nr:uncharacterized protein LOC128222266 [Mya arenaria]